MNLTKEDFFKKYSDNRLITLTFAHDNLDITIKDSWEINREIQKYVLHSNNCYFISLDYTISLFIVVVFLAVEPKIITPLIKPPISLYRSLANL